MVKIKTYHKKIKLLVKTGYAMNFVRRINSERNTVKVIFTLKKNN